MSLATGEVKWEKKRFGHAALVVADGKLIIMDERGELVVVEATPVQFGELARTKVIEGTERWACPVLYRGRIYCRAGADLVCLGGSNRDELGSH